VGRAARFFDVQSGRQCFLEGDFAWLTWRPGTHELVTAIGQHAPGPLHLINADSLGLDAAEAGGRCPA
jgi:hypothetical protein